MATFTKRKIAGLLMVVVMLGAFLLAACDPATVSVTGVTLNKTALTLIVGGDETLTATVAPATATDKDVTWKSGNETVATVVNGKVVAKAVGDAVITVTTKDGSKTATCAVKVIGTLADHKAAYTAILDDEDLLDGLDAGDNAEDIADIIAAAKTAIDEAEDHAAATAAFNDAMDEIVAIFGDEIAEYIAENIDAEEFSATLFESYLGLFAIFSQASEPVQSAVLSVYSEQFTAFKAYIAEHMDTIADIMAAESLDNDIKDICLSIFNFGNEYSYIGISDLVTEAIDAVAAELEYDEDALEALITEPAKVYYANWLSSFDETNIFAELSRVESIVQDFYEEVIYNSEFVGLVAAELADTHADEIAGRIVIYMFDEFGIYSSSLINMYFTQSYYLNGYAAFFDDLIGNTILTEEHKTDIIADIIPGISDAIGALSSETDYAAFLSGFISDAVADYSDALINILGIAPITVNFTVILDNQTIEFTIVYTFVGRYSGMPYIINVFSLPESAVHYDDYELPDDFYYDGENLFSTLLAGTEGFATEAEGVAVVTNLAVLMGILDAMGSIVTSDMMTMLIPDGDAYTLTLYAVYAD